MALKEITEEQYSETKQKFNKLVVVVTHPDKEACFGCQIYEPVLKKISEDMPDIEFRTISFKERGMQELKKDYKEQLNKVPATMIFENGKMIDKSVGAISYDDLKKVLDLYFKSF